ncbi:hypothetical protein HY488_01965 [Candidatus Woesearchaeota archaeon]|nr:hypothetical protein [Candidatus Woesearchaeota archaeon]
MKITSTKTVASITLVVALAAFVLMSFRKIPEIVFWIVVVPCTIIAYWLVPKMRERENVQLGKKIKKK